MAVRSYFNGPYISNIIYLYFHFPNETRLNTCINDRCIFFKLVNQTLVKQIFFTNLIVLVTLSLHVRSQSLAINTTGAAADPSAILDVRSTTKGILAPRMTATERNAISNLLLHRNNILQ
jgi:hypothetical protein